MKFTALIIFAFLICSCATGPRFTGQWYVEDSPLFYMSIAPTFDKPYEYEIQNEILVYREYSGFGGYDWGKKNTVAKAKTTREERIRIESLTMTAIADTIEIQQVRMENDELVVVTDGTSWYIQSGPVPFLSIETNQPESQAFKDLLNLLNTIMARASNGA